LGQRYGSTLYFEGPIPAEPNFCCSLYSTDLATLQTRVVASIPGSQSRDSFIFSGGLVYPATALSASGVIRGMSNSQLHLAPDGRWLFGVRSFRGPALDIYDVVRGEMVRSLTPPRSEDVWPSGTWAADRFYFFAATRDGTGRLWNVGPETTRLEEGVAVARSGQVPGCLEPATKGITAAGGKLFIYERFGFKGDRRRYCAGQIPGGAWMINPATGSLLDQIVPDEHLITLVGDRAGSILYGLASAKLLRIDPRDGRVLKSRVLDTEFLRIATAPIRVVPTGDVRSTFSVD
jgi:hypothetical protein